MTLFFLSSILGCSYIVRTQAFQFLFDKLLTYPGNKCNHSCFLSLPGVLPSVIAPTPQARSVLRLKAIFPGTDQENSYYCIIVNLLLFLYVQYGTYGIMIGLETLTTMCFVLVFSHFVKQNFKVATLKLKIRERQRHLQSLHLVMASLCQGTTSHYNGCIASKKDEDKKKKK